MKNDPSSQKGEDKKPLEHREIKRTLWQRWLAWNGSFLVVSLLVHIILIVLAGLLVVQVIQANKEKLRFTAAPPAPASVVHEVKHAKKTASAAPAVTKRITSTAINTSVALPTMDLNTSHNTDIMAAVMSGLGGAGLGAGAAGGGIASMPMEGLTAFGFKGNVGGGGLVGCIYDFKQTKDRQPTNIKNDGQWKNPHIFDGMKPWEAMGEQSRILGDRSKLGRRADLMTESVLNQAAVVNEFLDKGWDQTVFDRYYRSKDSLTAYQIFIPAADSIVALKAFGVEKEIKPTHFVILYKGTVVAPRDMTFRFRVQGRGVFLMRFDNQDVMFPGRQGGADLYHIPKFVSNDPETKVTMPHSYPWMSQWFTVEAGKKCVMQILLENSAEFFKACLYIEEKHPEKPYTTSFISELYPNDPPSYCFPVFALKKGMPLPLYDKGLITKAKDTHVPIPGEPHPEGWRPNPPFWDYPSDPTSIIFAGTR